MSPSRWHLVAGGGAGNAERIHGEGETTGCTPRGDMGTPGSPHTAEHGVGTAFFLPFWRRAATVRTRLSPHPKGRRRWEVAGRAEGRPPRRSLHCHAPSLCHPNAALPVPARFQGGRGSYSCAGGENGLRKHLDESRTRETESRRDGV